jgi:predicted HicB family RNase H-like nuclease
MDYQGYQGSVEYNEDDGVFFGSVMFLRPLLSYEGVDIETLRESFEETVDDYLEFCREQRFEPTSPPKSGR